MSKTGNTENTNVVREDIHAWLCTVEAWIALWSCNKILHTRGVTHSQWCSGIAQWLEQQTCDWKVYGPSRSSGRIVFSSVNFLCWLLYRDPFHPCVTTVTCKRSLTFCQKCRWQVRAKYTYILCMWLQIVTLLTGAWLYWVHRTCTKMAAVSCGIRHVTTKQSCIHLGRYSECAVESYSQSVAYNLRAVENSTTVATVKCLGLNSRWGPLQMFV